MRFSDIIGQEELKSHLTDSIDKGRISHAQLFTGIAGAGTLPLAIAYAQYLNCPNRKDGDSCGVCPSCQQIAQSAHPDVHFIYPVNKQGKKSGEVVLSAEFLPQWREIMSQSGGYFTRQEWYDKLDLGKTLQGMISAKEADEIIRRLSFKSFQSQYKVVIIWQAETMNEEAANKILKILEEPWENTVFLLVAERGDLLLKTILSRTQETSVPRLKVEDLVSLSGASEQERRNMARLAAGDVIQMRRMVQGEGDELREECFDLFCRLMRLSYNDKHLELLDWADEVAQLSREQQRQMLTHSARLLREAYMLHAGLGRISYLWGEEAKFCNNFAPFIGNQNIEILISEIESAMRQINQNGNARIVFTHFALAVSKQINRLK
ncbi:MAG: DNA polymerase III subunit delta [Alistipes sp.]|jgi:DNA polymerase-3 subunit delta'|nr:DNA polymerase III subunit delta [Alistipes sp.]MBQ1957308.1 DNA polymerase III subunit delta [Alistipes sp.]MBQ1980684.1 DNA polymerase III subunit delta [Alistipes sp.]MBQ2415086.1 DNA polymerase III subunit delta [Alistipes sp.]MBQ5622644.1 DNA polymerase III subunit delta [Alistipes sp.]